MTGAEQQMIVDLRDGMTRLTAKVDSLGADVAAIKAVTDTVEAHRTAEAGALWDKHGDIDVRLRAVEVTYATKVDTSAVALRVTTLEQSLARIIGIGVAVMAIVQVVGLAGLWAMLRSAGGAH